MPARSRLQETILDSQGQPIIGATVTVREPGTVNPLSQAMYAVPSGGSALTNPLTTDAQGNVLVYVASPQRADLRVAAPGMSTFTVDRVPAMPDPADMVLLDATQELTNKTLIAPVLQSPTLVAPTFEGVTAFDDGLLITNNDPSDATVILQNLDAGGKALEVRNPAGAVIGAWTKDGLRLDQLAIGPTIISGGNPLLVSGSEAQQNYQLVSFEFGTHYGGTGGDVSTLRSMAVIEAGAGSTQHRALEAHTILNAGGTLYGHASIDATLQGNFDSGGGIYNNVITARVLGTTWSGLLTGTPVRMDNGILIGMDEQGVKNGIWYIGTGAEGLPTLFKVDQNGVMLSKGSRPVATNAHDLGSASLFWNNLFLNTGIQFPTSPSLSANANTLDWYDERTFTMTLAGSSTAGSQTYSSQACRATRIGRAVYIEGYVKLSALDGATAGNMELRGLPWAAGSALGASFVASIWDGITLTAGNSMIGLRVNGTAIELRQNGSGIAGAALAAAAMSAGVGLMFSGHYFV